MQEKTYAKRPAKSECKPDVNQVPSGRLARLYARAKESTLARRAFSGTLWSLGGAVGGKGFTLFSSIYAARVLGRESYGEFGIVQSTLASFSMFAGLGLGLTANKYVAELRDTDPARAGRVIALSRSIAFITGLATTLFVFAFAGKLARGAMGAPSLAGEVRVASLALLFGAITGAQTGALYGFEAFQAIAQRNLIGGIASFLFMVGGVYFWGLMGGVWALVASGAIMCVLNYDALVGATKKYSITVKMAGSMSEWPTLVKFSLPAVLSGLSVVPANWACNLILVNQHNGYAEMGMLNAAIQWRNIILFVPGVLMSVALPMLTNLGVGGEHRKQKKLLLANVALAAALGFGAAAFVALLAKHIMGSFGAGFELGRNILILQAVAAAIAATVGVLGQFVVSLGEMWWLIVLQVVWASILLVLTWLLRSKGGEGVSMAYLLAYVVHFINMSAFTWWKLKRPIHRSHPKTVPAHP